MSYFKSDIIGHSKASLGIKAAEILMSIDKIDEANQLFNEITGKMPLVLQPNLILHKISANDKHSDTDYELCEKEALKLV